MWFPSIPPFGLLGDWQIQMYPRRCRRSGIATDKAGRGVVNSHLPLALCRQTCRISRRTDVRWRRPNPFVCSGLWNSRRFVEGTIRFPYNTPPSRQKPERLVAATAPASAHPGAYFGVFVGWLSSTARELGGVGRVETRDARFRDESATYSRGARAPTVARGRETMSRQSPVFCMERARSPGVATPGLGAAWTVGHERRDH